MKKKSLLVVFPCVCVLTGALSGIWAYRLTDTLTVQTPLTTNTLSIQMPSLQMDLADRTHSYLIPGDYIQASTHVLNDGDYEEYVRVTVEKSWTNDRGDPVNDADPSYILLHTDQASDWIVVPDKQSADRQCYYFTKPLSSSSITSNIIDAIEIGNIPSAEQNSYADLHIRLSFTAESVQRIAGKEAIRYEWDVPCTMDSQGQLIAIGSTSTH